MRSPNPQRNRALPRPLGEVQVGHDHHARVLVELAQQMEEQRLPAWLVGGQLAHLVESQHQGSTRGAVAATTAAASCSRMPRTSFIQEPIAAARCCASSKEVL